MRLLQLTTIPETLEAFLLPFAEHFRSLGWTVEAGAKAATSNARCMDAFDAVHDIDWSRNPASTSNFRAYRQVRRLIGEGTYDLVHVHTPVASFLTRLAMRSASSESGLVYTAHGFHFHEGGNKFKNNIFLWLEKLAGPWADELVVINVSDYEAALKHHLVDKSRLSHVPGIGFDAEAFRRSSRTAPSTDAIRSSIGASQDEVLFLMVAEFTPNKRQIDALEAFSRLGDLGARARLVFVGAGVELEPVRARSRSLGLEDRVSFLGYRRDVPHLLTAADALLLLSEREGLPVSILEAIAVGVPVIGTSVRGTKDLLAGGAGLLVSVHDPHAVAEALRKVIRRDPEVATASRVASERLSAYSLLTVLDAYSHIYERAISRARSRAASRG